MKCLSYSSSSGGRDRSGCYDDAGKTNDFTKSVVPADFVPYNGAKFIIKCPADWTAKFEQKTLVLPRPPKQTPDDPFPPLVMIDAFTLRKYPLKNGIRDVEKAQRNDRRSIAEKSSRHDPPIGRRA